MSATNGTAGLEKSGWLTKEGGSIKTWKKRWFVLNSKLGTLCYSKNPNTDQLGVININIASSIQPVEYKKKKFCFEINTPQRSFKLQGSDAADVESWITALKKVKEYLAAAARAASNPPTAGPTTSAPASASSAPSAPSNSHEEEKVGIADFDLLNLIGKGSFGKVMQVRKKDTGKIYAMKVLNKKTILERNELEHTKAEKSILQKLENPFLVNLYYSFQTPDKLYFIMDYVNGGELFYHLQKEKKFPEPRVRFYAAEIVLGLSYLHQMGIIYRDLKPENLLLSHDGHICMTDFGISKEGLKSKDDKTATFCGTPEYLAPEVLEGKGYGKEIDWWSFGTLMYEMLTGLPPFYSEDVQVMYARIMHAELSIPNFVSPAARDILQRLLERNPAKRLSDPEQIKAHPFFKGIDWEKLYRKEIEAPFIPPVKSALDVSQIDPTFTTETPKLSLARDSQISQTFQQNFEGFTFAADSELRG